MHIRPELKALRGDPASQRRAQAAMDHAFATWCQSEGPSAVIAAIGMHAEGVSLVECAPLARLMTRLGLAAEFVEEWARHFGGALDTEMLGLMPFRYSCSPGFTMIQLAASGTVSLSLATYEEMAVVQRSPSAAFADRCQHEVVIAGEAHGLVHRRDRESGAIASEQCHWQAGDRIVLRDNTQCREIRSVSGRFVTLQLVCGAVHPRPTCEYRLDDGALLHRSCADKRASQDEMALAVLGEMGRADAVPAMAKVASEGPSHLRWEAVRHALALDPLQGIALLSGMAARQADELCLPAAQLLEQLEQQHPQLFVGEDMPCPA